MDGWKNKNAFMCSDSSNGSESTPESAKALLESEPDITTLSGGIRSIWESRHSAQAGVGWESIDGLCTGRCRRIPTTEVSAGVVARDECPLTDSFCCPRQPERVLGQPEPRTEQHQWGEWLTRFWEAFVESQYSWFNRLRSWIVWSQLLFITSLIWRMGSSQFSWLALRSDS